jgi:hypothetical protein
VTLSGLSANDTSGAGANDDDEWTVTLSVKAPLYDGGQTKGKVRQEQATRAQAEQAVGKKEETVRAEIAQARLNAASSLETVGAARKNVSLAEESLRLAEVGYREGRQHAARRAPGAHDATEAGRALSSIASGLSRLPRALSKGRGNARIDVTGRVGGMAMRTRRKGFMGERKTALGCFS